MPHRVIGAILILAGCSGFGFLLAYQSIVEEQMLSQLVNALDYICCDLQFNMETLSVLFYNASRTTTGQLHRVLKTISTDLNAHSVSDPTECICCVLKKEQSIPGKVNTILINMSNSLGKFDLAGQLSGLEATKKLAQKELDKLIKNKQERIRTYRTLGICAGAALAIIMF